MHPPPSTNPPPPLQTPNTTTVHRTWQTRLTALTNSTLTHFFPSTPTTNNTPIEPACERLGTSSSSDDDEENKKPNSSSSSNNNSNRPTSCDGDDPERFYKGIMLRALAGAAGLVPEFRAPGHAVARALRATAEAAVRSCDGGGGGSGGGGGDDDDGDDGGEGGRERMGVAMVVEMVVWRGLGVVMVMGMGVVVVPRRGLRWGWCWLGWWLR